VYVPPAFDVSDREACHALIRRESFGLLVTVGADGAPFATHLPFLLDGGRGPHGTLRGHLARPNPQGQDLASGRRALAVFSGAHAYVSPAWYAVHPSVPTWNYVAVHASGVPRLVEDPAAVEAFLGELVATHEAGRPAPWRMESLSREYLERMMRGIVAFELPIDRLEGKAKLGQNRGAEDRAGAVAGLRAAGDPWSAAVADLMAATDTGRPRA
jgi:transcriptional regulator